MADEYRNAFRFVHKRIMRHHHIESMKAGPPNNQGRSIMGTLSPESQRLQLTICSGGGKVRMA